MALTLRLIIESDPEATFLLQGQDVVVGRDPRADLVISRSTISGRHGLFRAGSSGYAFVDLGSRNGSALRRSGKLMPIRSDESVPIGPGDLLLLGSADSPVRIRVELGTAPYEPDTSLDHTLVATQPLADLLESPPDALLALAASVIAAGSASELARAALQGLSALVPGAENRCVRLVGAGFATFAGESLPDGLAAAGRDRIDVSLFADEAEPLPQTRSIVGERIRSAVVAPLLVQDTRHGLLAAWSSRDPIPRSVLTPLSLAAGLVALACHALSIRRREEPLPADPADPCGSSPAFLAALTLCRTVAASDVPVVLMGETGTGKEVLARAIHRWSRRAAKPFVAFNCAAVPESLFESEMFGHVRGAFSGAGTDRRGLFEEADGGTILLDEIGEMPLSMQAKLLRVLQDGEVRRVGANRTTRCDVRVVSATNRDLGRQIEEGSFRRDLLYRLNAVSIHIPPLRERGDDVLLLAHHLLGKACRRADRRIPGFSAEALAVLRLHPFPGNVRELENEIARAVALTPDGETVRPEVFSEALQCVPVAPPAPGSLQARVEEAERRFVQEALERAGGNLSQAARDLGLSRQGLYKVLQRLGMRGRVTGD